MSSPGISSIYNSMNVSPFHTSYRLMLSRNKGIEISEERERERKKKRKKEKKVKRLKTEEKIFSRAWFRSTDLWVMGPARFHCATLLYKLVTVCLNDILHSA